MAQIYSDCSIYGNCKPVGGTSLSNATISGFNVSDAQTLQGYTWNTGWTNILKGLADALYSPIVWAYNQTTPFTNWLSGFHYDYNQTSTKGSYIAILNTSVSSGVYNFTNTTTWTTSNAVISAVDITTECSNWNLTFYDDDAKTSPRYLYANRYKNASSYGSLTYSDGNLRSQVHAGIWCNSGADTFRIKLTGVTA